MLILEYDEATYPQKLVTIKISFNEMKRNISISNDKIINTCEMIEKEVK